MYPGPLVRPALFSFIQKSCPTWDGHQDLCQLCLNKARSDLVEHHLKEELGVLNNAELEVIQAIRDQETITTAPAQIENKISFGARLADKIADVGGSWGFIIGFAVVLLGWITINSVALLREPFDPYPYILLNLVLSCLAAIQAPIIMMSQNRQEEKDRLRAEADYKTNLKAELEVRHLHIKLDQLLGHQWKQLLEIQQVQLDAIRENLEKSKKH